MPYPLTSHGWAPIPGGTPQPGTPGPTDDGAPPPAFHSAELMNWPAHHRRTARGPPGDLMMGAHVTGPAPVATQRRGLSRTWRPTSRLDPHSSCRSPRRDMATSIEDGTWHCRGDRRPDACRHPRRPRRPASEAPGAFWRSTRARTGAERIHRAYSLGCPAHSPRHHGHRYHRPAPRCDAYLAGPSGQDFVCASVAEGMRIPQYRLGVTAEVFLKALSIVRNLLPGERLTTATFDLAPDYRAPSARTRSPTITAT